MYTSPSRLLTSNIENGYSLSKAVRRPNVLDFRVGMMGATMGLAAADDEELRLSVTTGRYILAVFYSPHQTNHDNLEVRDGRSPRFFVQLLRLILYLCHCALHHTSMCATR